MLEEIKNKNDWWIKSRSGNPTIRTEPYRGENIEYLGEFCDWYRVFRLAPDLLAISEPYHSQGVFAFLIFGEKKVMLLDTCLGMCDIRPIVEQFVPKELELIVVNTHTHFDHVGNNWRFDKAYIYDSPVAIHYATEGWKHEELLAELGDSNFYAARPDGFTDEQYIVKPFSYALLHDGDKLDLGGRVLSVIHTPGHADDEIMLYDADKKMLFTGDAYYPGRLYLLESWNQLDIYIDTLEMLLRRLPEIDMLIPSHNYPQDDPAILPVVLDAMRALKAGKGPEGRYMDDFGDWVRGYDFEGCTIVLPTER